MPAEPLAPIALLAVVLVPEKQRVDQSAGQAPGRSLLQTPRPRRDGFVRHAEAFIFGPDKRIDGLINGN